MKRTLRYGAAAVLFGMSAAAQAGALSGLFTTHGGGCRKDACCEDPCCEDSAPVVARPCEQTYTYQRKCSTLDPPCCDAPCCEEDPCCEPACDGASCTNGLCIKKKSCNLLKGLFGKKKRHAGCLGDAGCAENCTDAYGGDDADPCEIAKLIYQAQTACYADDRADAVDELGEYDCRCHPEIMVVLVYSLNDADEKVRKQAADEIGDLLEEGRCCCSPEVVSALTCALGDCDDDVRRQAEEALEVCGYEVVEGCCKGGGCADQACGDVGAAAQSTPAPTPAEPAPAPAPAETAPAPPADPAA